VNRGKRTPDDGYWCQAKVAHHEDLFQVVGRAENLGNDVVLRGARRSKGILLEVLCFFNVAVHYL
jgi:hypothetical protein